MTKPELEEKLRSITYEWGTLYEEYGRLENICDNDRKNYLRQIAKLKIANKKMREKLKLAKTS
jgi:hypothetical protein